jgi:hypothetical protein
MAYIGQGIKEGTFSVLDTSGNTYNGSNTTFSLGTQVGSPAQLLVSHDGVIQKAGTDYSLASGGTQITFSTAPASGASIFIVEISGAVGGPLASDLNGTELILDADGDTSITADTDDQIDIKVAGTDQITIKDGAVSPVTDNDVDLGTTSLEFKDGYFDGTLHCDVLDLAGTEYTSISTDTDINGATQLSAEPASGDEILIYDTSASANRKITFNNFTLNDRIFTSMYLTANTSSGTSGDLTANWANQTVGPDNAITQSSGVFSFPQTGYYLITFTAQAYIDNNDNDMGFYIKTTTDNSNYTTLGYIRSSDEGDEDGHQNVTGFYIFDVTDTSNCKVKFGVSSVASGNFVTGASGATGFLGTHVVFQKLAST